MLNYGYHLARARGAAARRAYAAMLPTIIARALRPTADIPLDVFSYSGEAALPEQVASIRSFLRHAGRPRKFTIVSDGTYSQRSIGLLRQLDECVEVSEAAAWTPANVDAETRAYLTGHPTGKQLGLIMCLPAGQPALYVDSDVLFFAGAAQLRNVSAPPTAPALYQEDCQLSADERLLRTPSEHESPVNTGVLLLLKKLDWSLSLERFRSLEGAPTFFTNQTMTHLTMHANGAEPLDRRKFVLQLDDQFVYRDAYAGPEVVLRHYVNPVRHKMWSSLWR